VGPEEELESEREPDAEGEARKGLLHGAIISAREGGFPA
jgi:hypothetical protein